MLKTTSKARKQNLGLTVTQATSQARRHVDKIMPGVAATVESRLSADVTTLEPIVITEVTFPHQHPACLDLQVALNSLGVRKVESFPSRLIITRMQ